MKWGIRVWVGLAALILSILACGPRVGERPEAEEEEDPPIQQVGEEPPSDVVENPPDAEEEQAPPPPAEEPPADDQPEPDRINIAEELAFGGGGGDGAPFICPDNASGAGPSVVFGRDRAPYEYSRLCFYDLDLSPGTELMIMLISPEGSTIATDYYLEDDPDYGLVAMSFEDDDFPLSVTETRYGTYQAEVAVFIPPSQPVGEWLVEINDGIVGPLVLPFVVPAFTHEALFVVPENSNPFYSPLCCYSGEPVRYEGAGLLPDHFYVLGGYIIPPELPSDGVRLFQTEVFTDDTGTFVVDGAAPASDDSGNFCLALLDPETEELILEDNYLGSLCRSLNP